jgi:hypothetical protein
MQKKRNIIYKLILVENIPIRGGAPAAGVGGPAPGGPARGGTPPPAINEIGKN